MADEKRSLDEEFWWACSNGELEKVQELKGKGADVNWVHPWEPPGRARQATPLWIAANNGHKDVVKWLGEKGGVDINKKAMPYSETALENIAAAKGEGQQACHAYLKMKTAMLAVMAAQKFAAMQKKPEKKAAPEAPAAPVAAS